MTSRIFVLDANIAIKVLYDEPDSDQAISFLRACVENDDTILVPEHFIYELMNVCERLDIDLTTVFDFFERLKGSLLTVVTPQKSIWLLAEKIAKDGSVNAGFPSIYDSIYHALAIEAGGIFVTADRRHFTKANRWKHITLLKDVGWPLTFSSYHQSHSYSLARCLQG